MTARPIFLWALSLGLAACQTTGQAKKAPALPPTDCLGWLRCETLDELRYEETPASLAKAGLPGLSTLPEAAKGQSGLSSGSEGRFAWIGSQSKGFDIPMQADPLVQLWIDKLSGPGRQTFSKWLERAGRYVPLFESILADYGLPRDLVFLAMIESGFKTDAASWASAVGPWQFMPRTARSFGLRVGFWIDERRDFVKSTHAAARYLERLYLDYGDWHLAFAAYNAGPATVSRALERTGNHGFWPLTRSAWLQDETKQYVPKLLAAAEVSKNARRYGLDPLEYAAPLAWEFLLIEDATDLGTLSQACGLASEDSLRELNPELRAGVTPPGEPYRLRVPPGTRTHCQAGLAKLDIEDQLTYRYHLVQPGDTVARIAQRYKTSPEAILRFNQMKRAEQLQDFEELVVPVPKEKAGALSIVSPSEDRQRSPFYGPQTESWIRVTVRRGDSLWRLSMRHNVSVRQLRRDNGLRSNKLSIGQRLRVRRGSGRP